MSAVKQIKQYKSGRFYRDAFRGKRSWNGNEHNVLLRNETGPDGRLRFSNIAQAVGAASIEDGRGMAVFDFNNDGRLDILTQNHPGDQQARTIAPTLLRNDLGAHRNWVAFELTGTKSNRDAIGALLTLKYRRNGTVHSATRHVSAGSGYASQHGKRLHVGLGDSTEIVSATIRWPSGERQEFSTIPKNAILQIREGDPAIAIQRTVPRVQTTSKPSDAPQ